MTNSEWIVYQYGTVTLKVWVLVEVGWNYSVELTTSRISMGHKGSEWQGCSDSEIYLNSYLTYGFQSVLSDYFNHNAIRPLKSDLHY